MPSPVPFCSLQVLLLLATQSLVIMELDSPVSNVSLLYFVTDYVGRKGMDNILGGQNRKIKSSVFV
jgi:hypothetical protein